MPDIKEYEGTPETAFVLCDCPVILHSPIRSAEWKTDRNVRGVRETAIKQIRKKYKTALETRLLHLPWTLTLDEKYFLENGVRTKDEKNSEKQ